MTRRAVLVTMGFAAVLLLGAAGPAAASCIAQTEAQATAAADVIFEGESLLGTTGFRDGLIAPYRFRVDRYLKGSGPVGEITVHSGAFVDGVHYDSPQLNSGTSIDLFVKAGQRWVIFANRLEDGSLNTFSCTGSHLVGEAGIFYEPPPPAEASMWGAAAAGVAGLALVMGLGAWIAARITRAN